MSIFSLGFFGVAGAGIAAMTGAFERGDLDETSRQGVLAGPAVVEGALSAPARSTRLAAIVAAPRVEGGAELLPALATLAGGGDRRTAIPAARAARTLARDLALRELPDDLATDDLAGWRAQFDQLAANPHRFIEVRVLALDTVASLAQVLDPGALGFDLATALADADPAYRAIAIGNVPRPTPVAAMAPLANTVKNDADDRVALAAAQVLCGDDPAAARPLLAAQGLDRIKKLVGGKPARAIRDASKCLAR
jgi:hypothetical protein